MNSKKHKSIKERKVLYCISKGVCKVLLKILYGVKCYGKENIPKDGSIIFAGNHKHAYDPVLVITNTKRFVHFYAKEEVSGGLRGVFMRKLGTIIVYKDKKKNISSIVDGEKILKDGGSIGIFPEGTRNRTEEILLPFRYGTVRIAQKTKSKIVPFSITGEYKVFKRGLKIQFGEPIDVFNMDPDDGNEYLRNEIIKLLKK